MNHHISGFIQVETVCQFYYLQMNPENCGEMISLRHTALWRQSMWPYKDVAETPKCHQQLNELGSMGQSWRSRENFVSTHYSNKNRSTLPRSKRSKELVDLLKKDMKQTGMTNSLMTHLNAEADRIDRNRSLVQGMQKLKQMGLMNGKDLNKVKFPGSIKYAHIYNDYHGRVSNPGYHRSQTGGKFYTK